MANEVVIRIVAQDHASAPMSRIADNASKLGLALAAGLASAAVAAGAAVAKSVLDFTSMGDALDEMHSRTGFSVEALSELQHAAKLSGTDLQGLEVSVRRMQRTITDAAEGSKSAASALGALGLSVQDLQGLSPEEQFNKITAALADVEDATQKAALAQDIFGRSGTSLLPMLDGGAAGLAKMRQEARDLGVVMSEDDAKAAAEFADVMDNLKERVSGVMFSIARVAVPILLEIADWLGPRIAAVVEAAKIAFTVLSDVIGEQWARWLPFYEAEVAPALEAIEHRVQQVIDFIAEYWPLISAIVTPVLAEVQLIVETVFSVIAGVIRIALDVIQGDWKGAWGNIQGVVATVAGAIAGTVSNLMGLIEGLFKRLGELKGLAGSVVRAALGPVGAAAGLVESLDIPGFATGGVVPGPRGAPTLAVVHGGETVVPAGQSMGGMTLVFNGDIYGFDDFQSQVVNAINRAVATRGPVLDAGALSA